MGRKAIARERKIDIRKTNLWIAQLFPYIQKNGLKGLTMDAVAQYLDKSKTTIYEYFQTKEQIVAAVVDYKLSEIDCFQTIIYDNNRSFTERVFDMLAHQADHISDISTLFLADLKNLYPELWHRIDDFLDHTAEVMREFYAQGIAAGEFNTINPTLLALNDQLFMRMLTNPDFLAKYGLTLQEALRQYAEIVFFGVLKNKVPITA